MQPAILILQSTVTMKTYYEYQQFISNQILSLTHPQSELKENTLTGKIPLLFYDIVVVDQ